MSWQHVSWILSWPSSLAVASNFAESQPERVLRHSVLGDVLVFIIL